MISGLVAFTKQVSDVKLDEVNNLLKRVIVVSIGMNMLVIMESDRKKRVSLINCILGT